VYFRRSFAGSREKSLDVVAMALQIAALAAWDFSL
jgi:hypothetical protein